jgi:hypothetical protein
VAEYRITYWREIPSQVEASGDGNRVRRLLSGRFQELIDAAAMREGLSGTDAYLEAWQMGPRLSMVGAPKDVAEAIAAQLEQQFEEIRARALKNS